MEKYEGSESQERMMKVAPCHGASAPSLRHEGLTCSEEISERALFSGACTVPVYHQDEKDEKEAHAADR